MVVKLMRFYRPGNLGTESLGKMSFGTKSDGDDSPFCFWADAVASVPFLLSSLRFLRERRIGQASFQTLPQLSGRYAGPQEYLTRATGTNREYTQPLTKAITDGIQSAA